MFGTAWLTLRQAREALANGRLEEANRIKDVFLATELVRLGQERSELIARVDQLTARTQQLAANVQDLERQSPYAL